MIRHEDSQLFYQDTVHKDWFIHIVEDDVTLTNEDILVDELTIQESLCSDQSITLGACASSSMEFQMFNKGTSLKGKTLRVSLVLDNHTTNPIPIGVYKVEEDTIQEDERIREIKAHDALYEILEKDFADWFNNLASPTLTCKQFRDSFLQYAGIEQEDVTLINDWLPFTFTISNSAQTQRMIEAENELIDQRKRQAELGVVLYDYTQINLSTYDVTKKKHVTDYNRVTPQSGANPHQNNWYAIATKGQHIGEYVLTQDTEVKIYEEFTPVIPQEGDNPHANGWYAIAQRGAHKGEMVPTQDTTVDPDKTYYERTVTEKAYFEKVDRDFFSPYELGWYENPLHDGNYVESKDEEADITKSYYERTEHPIPAPSYKEVIGSGTDNPSELNWYEYDPNTNHYSPTEDQTINPNKTYYEQCIPENRGSAMMALNPDIHSRENPKESGWYEYVANQDAYLKTEDTTVDHSKEYYINIWEINQNDRSDIIQDEIKGADLITAVCEMNGVFGHIDREGIFRYVKLKPIDFEGEGLYPSPDLYPDPNLYPAGQPVDWTLTRGMYETCTKESYVVQKLDRLVICKEDGDAGYVYPAGSHDAGYNTYKIQGNFIWYSFTEDQETLDVAGMNILTNGIAQISEYTPCEIDAMGNPCMEVGDSIKIITRLGTFYTYVLERTLTGSQRLRDTIKAKGEEKRLNESNLYNSVIELKGKSNILTRNIDMTRNEIVDLGENMSSLIEQTAESIKFEVSKEVQNVVDNTNEKYKSSMSYTDRLISQTVTKTLYDESQKELEEWKSGIDVSFDNITAEVSHTVKETGGSEGFKWELVSTGWTLSAMGGYTLANYTATGDMINANPVGTENPYAEWWHEQVSGGGYLLTTDTTVKSGKTYYKSRQNPASLGWFEIDTEHSGYKLTTDTCIHEYKSYYIQNQSSEYKPILTATAGGVVIDGFLKTTMLDVKNVASFGMVRAIEMNVDNLIVNDTIRAQQINALTGQFNTLAANALTAETLRAQSIDASQITTGTISADRVRIAQWLSSNNVSVGGYVSGTRAIFDGVHFNQRLTSDDDDLDRAFSWKAKRVTINGQPMYVLADLNV